MKTSLNHSILALMIASLLFIFSGCDNSDFVVKTGTLLDSAVEGVEYETMTQSGTTDAEGLFYYGEGEIISFFLEGILLGQTKAKEIITPVDLISGAYDETHPHVINMCRFLQSLDADADPDNGILISPEVRDEFGNYSIVFTQSCEDFENDDEVRGLFETLNMLGYFPDTNERSLISADQASAHFKQTLESLVSSDDNDSGDSGDDSDDGDSDGG
ncbi:hypothetical protein [Desulfonema magnum]|uniref:DUF4825 domain-containing protein n=1 Tax=Desulfonema magnum TaxID=45655 RepID=A0A975BWH9_9BACT|nr:hypothetical protein [Desulfonema magnum]QTA93036.1 Uncharacterized protein dnm_091310 [Desulfonema magnum]